MPPYPGWLGRLIDGPVTRQQQARERLLTLGVPIADIRLVVERPKKLGRIAWKWRRRLRASK